MIVQRMSDGTCRVKDAPLDPAKKQLRNKVYTAITKLIGELNMAGDKDAANVLAKALGEFARSR